MLNGAYFEDSDGVRLLIDAPLDAAAGLVNRKPPGQPAKLTDAHRAALGSSSHFGGRG
jgi:hypothetical protein